MPRSPARVGRGASDTTGWTPWGGARTPVHYFRPKRRCGRPRARPSVGRAARQPRRHPLLLRRTPTSGHEQAQEFSGCFPACHGTVTPLPYSRPRMTGETTRDRRILVVEDEADLRELLTYNLTAAGFTVQATETGTEGLEAVHKFAPDVVLLDLMLPDIPGTEVCRRIRGDTNARQPAVMMLTAKGEEIDRVVGFELGADDYVVKPFSVRELVLRVGAILRARHPAPAA